MKFENINSEKFSQFENQSISNLKLIVGGDWTNTERPAGYTYNYIDRYNTGQGPNIDGWDVTTYADDHIAWGIG